MLTTLWFVISALLYLAPAKFLSEDKACAVYFGGFGVLGFPLCLAATAWAHHDIAMPIWTFVYGQ